MHATHAPALHTMLTMLVPQEVPFTGRSPIPRKGCARVAGGSSPVRKGRPAESAGRAPPCISPQVPVALQTRLVPHAVPAGHVRPCVRALRGPGRARQRPLVAGVGGGARGARLTGRALSGLAHHAGSAGAFRSAGCSISVQTGAPVAQVMVPVRHGFPVTAQALPAVHAAQLPLMQTMSWFRRRCRSPGAAGWGCSRRRSTRSRGADATRVGRRTGRTGVAGRHLAIRRRSCAPLPRRDRRSRLPPRARRRQANRARRASPLQPNPEQTRSKNRSCIRFPITLSNGSKAKTASNTTRGGIGDAGQRPRGRRPLFRSAAIREARTTRTPPPPAPPRRRSRRPTA